MVCLIHPLLGALDDDQLRRVQIVWDQAHDLYRKLHSGNIVDVVPGV